MKTLKQLQHPPDMLLLEVYMRKRKLSTWRKIKFAAKSAIGGGQAAASGTYYAAEQASAWGHELWEPRRHGEVRTTPSSKNRTHNRESVKLPKKRSTMVHQFGTAPNSTLKMITAFLVMFSLGLIAGIVFLLTSI